MSPLIIPVDAIRGMGRKPGTVRLIIYTLIALGIIIYTLFFSGLKLFMVILITIIVVAVTIFMIRHTRM